MNNIQILDCTLRDGGYVNNWEFSKNDSIDIISGIYSSGVRNIEIGILENGCKGNGTKFVNFEEIEPLLENKKNDCKYAVMATVNGMSEINIPKRSSKTVDIVRLAFFKEDFKSLIKLTNSTIEKGYDVFIQPMATFMYSDLELKEMITEVNKLKPYAFYMVDSFSNLYPKDIRNMAEKILDTLDENICFGLHAHNNIQMAFANVIEFMSLNTARNLYVDGSIFGMGRGAGNVPTELLMEYLNKENSAYNATEILKTYQQYLEPIYKKYGWGYSMPYYLTATKSMNSVYGWYLLRNDITNIEMFNDILESIPEGFKHKLNKDCVTDIINNLK